MILIFRNWNPVLPVCFFFRQVVFRRQSIFWSRTEYGWGNPLKNTYFDLYEMTAFSFFLQRRKNGSFQATLWPNECVWLRPGSAYGTALRFLKRNLKVLFMSFLMKFQVLSMIWAMWAITWILGRFMTHNSEVRSIQMLYILSYFCRNKKNEVFFFFFFGEMSKNS